MADRTLYFRNNKAAQCTVSFLGYINGNQTFIYSGFSPPLHLQCGLIQSKDLSFTVTLWTGHPIDYMIDIVE